MFSKILCSHVDVDILLPSLPDNEAYLERDLKKVYQKKQYPALYLLHGALDDHSMWIRNTNIEAYAEQARIAVVMPSGQNGFYVNAKYGLNYFDFITKELPLFIETYFPVSEDRYIAGPSMGGYGAARCALGCPEMYEAFADLSGAVDPSALEPQMAKMGFDFFRYDLIWGAAEYQKGSGDDLFQLAERYPQDLKKPRAFIYCGNQDVVNFEMNRKLYEQLKQSGFDASFSSDDGAHDWRYWDKAIKAFLERVFQ